MLSRKLRLAALVIAILSLTSCAQGVSSPPLSVCPAVVEYPLEFQRRLADEIMALPADSAIVTAMVDYSRTRKELRACR